MFATGECILKTDSSVHKKPLIKIVTLAGTQWIIQIPQSVSALSCQGPGLVFLPIENSACGSEMQGNISCFFSLQRVSDHCSFVLIVQWSLIKNSLKWRDHFYELHGLGNQAVDLPEKIPGSEAVKKHLNNVIKHVWHTEGCEGEAAALHKKMKGKARIPFRRMLERSGQDRSWKEILVHKYGDNRSEMRIEYSKTM